MKIRGIIFDKDGTLMEFSDLWQCAVEELFNEYSLSEEVKEDIREKIGIKSDSTIRENSILASGTMDELFEVISMYILNSEDEIYENMEEFFSEYLKSHSNMIKETCDLDGLFNELKNDGIKIGVITADNYRQARFCFQILKLEKYIEFLGSGDRYLNKPNPQALQAFCKKFSLDMNEVAVVGDSDIDMQLGKHAGLSIGVLSGVGTEKMLLNSADVVVKSPCDILSVIDNYNKLR